MKVKDDRVSVRVRTPPHGLVTVRNMVYC